MEAVACEMGDRGVLYDEDLLEVGRFVFVDRVFYAHLPEVSEFYSTASNWVTSGASS